MLNEYLQMLTLGHVFAAIGALLTAASYLMKSMLPLRLVALAANVFFVLYGYLEAVLPSLLLYALMIPINAKKAWDIRKLLRQVESARADQPVMQWLVPHMKRRTARAGKVLWRTGDSAKEMVYVETGQLRIEETGKLLGPDVLVGEIGVFSPDGKRTRTLVCHTDCVLHRLTAEAMAQMHYQHPQIGFQLMKLVVARLMNDVSEARTGIQPRPPMPTRPPTE